MKRFELAIALLLIPLDFLMLLVAAVAAYNLRFVSTVTEIRPVVFDIEFATFLASVVPVILGWLGIYALAGLYNIRHPRRILTEVKKILVASTLGFAAVTVLIFLRGELFNSRFIVLAAVVLAIVFVTVARLLVRAIKFAFYRHGIGCRRVVLVGNDKTASDLAAFIARHSNYGMKVVCHIKTWDESAPGQLNAFLSKHPADLILLAAVTAPRETSESLLDLAREHHLPFHYAADLFDTKAANTEISTIGDMPIVEIRQTHLEGWGRIFKRIFDLVVGGIMLIIALPFMALIALAIKIESPGPVIYKNQRVGKGGALFFVYKFRRMKREYCTGPGYDNDGHAAKTEAELIRERNHRQGPLYKISDDPRSTRVGNFLEKTSLDELPQLFNVMAGTLSLVGPRPHQPREVDRYQKHHKRVLAIKPGITGLAQISGRSDLDFEEEVRLDTYYLEDWAIRLDLAVLLKTPFVLLRKHK
ncbi:MAG: sugar transferase [Parcubacteria group bacterium]|nr:sugar transferase [Parcubacteria group bacterium]